MSMLGKWCVFTKNILHWSIQKPFRFDQLFKQFEFVGVRSTWIVILTSFFSGAVFALQIGRMYAKFNMENLVGATVALSIVREIGPVFTAIMVTARACSAMAAEIGTMKVSEQVAALETMAVNPIHYLIVPRVIATCMMLPLLTILYDFVAVIGAYLVSVNLLAIDAGPLMNYLYDYVDVGDIWGGLLKASVFGFLISVISCFAGFHTHGGAKGVGSATTRAVVFSCVSVLIADYFLTTWIIALVMNK